MKAAAANYASIFHELIFYRLRSKRIRVLPVVGQVFLYLLAALLFYVPVLLFLVSWCRRDVEIIPYALALFLVHIIAKVMLYNSKRIQQRFSRVKASKHFLMRSWLIFEYVVFMWLVYLTYPLTCILIPSALWVMFVQQLMDSRFLFDLFHLYPDQFFLIGGMISYIIFIFADGYKKIRNGFLPDYLGLYAVLSVISGAAEKLSQKLVSYVGVDITDIREGLSRMFALSNDSMSMVASAMTLFFAIYSLYTTTSPEQPGEPKLEELPYEPELDQPKETE